MDRKMHRTIRQNCQKRGLSMNINFPKKRRSGAKHNKLRHILKISTNAVYLENQLSGSNESLKEKAGKH